MVKIAIRKESGQFLGHTPCEACGSKDNRGVWEDADGSFNSYCFGCHAKEQNIEEPTEYAKQVTNTSPPQDSTEALNRISNLESIEIPERRLAKETTEKYEVKSYCVDGKEKKRAYPYFKEGKLTGYKVRELPKKFYSVGDMRGELELFGQCRFKSGGRMLVITAGEEDAMSAYQMLKGHSKSGRGWPCVSLRSAGDMKGFKANLEWIDSFESVIFAVDQEELDFGYAKEMLALLTPGKGKIAKFSENDASDMLVKGKGREFWASIWEAIDETPSGIVKTEDLWSLWKDRGNYEYVSFPECWGMNSWNYGLYCPSLFVLTAGTGVGKSSVMKTLQLHLFKSTDAGIGVITMEEPVSLCTGILMGMHLERRITLPDVVVSEDTIKKAHDELFNDGRFVFCENVGIRTPEDLYAKIRYMANAKDCKYIFLDHLTAIVNKFNGSGNKNDYTELLVNTLNDLSQELGICIVLVSHVRKTGDDSGKTYETGKVPTEDSIFGSSSIKQYSHCTIAISRDKTQDPSITHIHILKDRISGKTGKSNPLEFCGERGIFIASSNNFDTELDNKAPF